MGRIDRFEDIEAWQRARDLTRLIYHLTRREPLCKDWDLQRQLRRASVSIMANIAEGFGRKSSKEFANYLNMAHASAAEVQSRIYVALDQNYLNRSDFEECYAMCEECSRMTQSFQNYLSSLKDSDSRQRRNSQIPQLLNS